jgi:hypothetical protein
VTHVYVFLFNLIVILHSSSRSSKMHCKYNIIQSPYRVLLLTYLLHFYIAEGKISIDHKISGEQPKYVISNIYLSLITDNHEAPSALYSTSASSPLWSPFSHSSPTIVDDEVEYWDEADEVFFATTDLTTPQSTSPLIPFSPMVLSRWSKQSPSTTSKVAYVLFTTGGNKKDLGVYYNWYVLLLTIHFLN